MIDIAYEKKYIGCTFKTISGLANQLFRFASLYGIGKYTGREPYFDARNSEMMEQLQELGTIFPMVTEVLNVKSPPEMILRNVEFSKECCKYDNPEKLIGLSDKYIKVSGNYLQSYKYFDEFKDEIREILECGATVKVPVDNFAKELFRDDNNHKFCVHIRRGDFIKHIAFESTESFTIPALKFSHQFLKEKLSTNNISVVFIGNDHEFVKNLDIRDMEIKIIYTPEPRPKGEDMCFGMNYCDSMLITASASTFGWWMSYLMKPNSTVFYNSHVSNFNISKDIHDFNYFLHDWVMVSVKDNVAFRETKWWHQRNNVEPDL